jgi:glucan endo-1,3-beta-D-glucosidase
VITSNTPAPVELAPTAATSQSRLAIESLPTASAPPVGLQGPFEAPNLIVPVDKSDPSKVMGNGYVAQLSPTLSTVFVFDVRPETQGKTCNLALYVPPAFPWPDMSPVKIRSPGGIIVSSVGQHIASANISASNVVNFGVVGWVPSVQPANQYNLQSLPCAAGQTVAYEMESTGGLIMDFFQMTVPPLGLFMSVS